MRLFGKVNCETYPVGYALLMFSSTDYSILRSKETGLNIFVQ